MWSRKVVAWDVAEREDPVIAADLICWACLCKRISKCRQQQLVLHADGQRLAAGFSKICVVTRWRFGWGGWTYCDCSQGPGYRTTAPTSNHYSSRQTTAQITRVTHSTAKTMVVNGSPAFVDSHNQRHSGIKFVTPQQLHCGQDLGICQHP